jgi:CubicO group peptidase (beta-lactamase class C family)
MTRTRWFPLTAFITLLLAWSILAAAQSSVAPFGRAKPEDVGLSAPKLQEAVEAVQSWVDADRVVGAAMLVMRDDRIVLHEAVGWADRERKIPLRTEHIFRMRSNTKPLVGTAVLMLFEEGKLKLDDKVSRYLPSFDNPKSREITIFQLLTHTSGITGDIYDPFKGTTYKTLREAVDEVGAKGPEFTPGTRYHYSDPGTSTLGALIAEVSGMPAEDFIQRRVLDPLGMRDSFCNIPEDERRERMSATYRKREGGGWDKYWDHTQPQLIPFFRASGGLKSTTMDYAKFMAMAYHKGEFGGKRLLSQKTIELATQPHSLYVLGPKEREQSARAYGLHWSVRTQRDGEGAGPESPGSFGHGGSDGTTAIADTQEGLIILYFAQSRGHDTRRDFVNLVYGALTERRASEKKTKAPQVTAGAL